MAVRVSVTKAEFRMLKEARSDARRAIGYRG